MVITAVGAGGISFPAGPDAISSGRTLRRPPLFSSPDFDSGPICVSLEGADEGIGATMRRRSLRMSRRTSLAVLWAAYLWTIAVAWAVGSFLPVESPLAMGLIIDLVATLMILSLIHI